MRITRVFLQTDMRMSFKGLREVAEENSAGLGVESTIIFVNRALTKFKLLRANKYIVYYSNDNKRIPLEALAELPEAFGGSKIEVQKAIQKTIEKKMRKKKLAAPK